MARTKGASAAATEAAIRDAAARLFAAQGFAAVSMRQIAAEVGVQAGTLYNYFPDKQSLLCELIRADLDARLAALPAAPEGQGALDALEGFVRAHIAHLRDNADAAALAEAESRQLSPENRQAIAAPRARHEAELERILRAGKAEGVFTLGDVRLTAQALLAMLNGAAAWARQDGRLAPDRRARMLWNMARKAVGA